MKNVYKIALLFINLLSYLKPIINLLKFTSIAIIFMCILVIFLWVEWGRHEGEIFNFITGSNLNIHKYSDFGTWGDTYGSFNALLTSLGFLGIVTTIIIQYISFRHEKINSHKQRVESLIFEQIELIRELKKEIIFSYPNKRTDKEKKELSYTEYTIFGTKFFEKKVFDYKNNDGVYRSQNAMIALEKHISREIVKKGRKTATKNDINKIYEGSFHKKYESRVAPFFRTIYYILEKIMSDSYLSKKEKIEYGNLIRGQLSSAEASILGVNALSDFSKDLYEIIIYFRLLKYSKKIPLREKSLEKFILRKLLMEGGA